MSWTTNPAVLLTGMSKANAFWPLANHESTRDRLAALARWVIVLSIVFAAVLRNAWVLIWGVILLAGLYVAASVAGDGGKKKPVPAPPPAKKPTSDNDPFQFIGTPENPNPELLNGIARTEMNEYGNPMPYSCGVEVRSMRSDITNPPPTKPTQPWVNHLYSGTDELEMGLFANPLPDQTLVAGPAVFWPYDPQPDIVSSDARLADRWQTY